MGKHNGSIDSKVMSRIQAKGRGYIFSQSAFLDLGGRDALDHVLSRNARAGLIRKLARGLYDYPRKHPRLGLLAPSVDAVAKALQDKDSSRLQVSGAHAANLLGLSEQVPMKAVFLTDGRTRKVQLGRQTVILKKTTPRQMVTAGRISGTVIQALRWLGQTHVDDKVVASLQRKLSKRDKQQLLDDIRFAPAWIGEILRRVAAK